MLVWGCLKSVCMAGWGQVELRRDESLKVSWNELAWTVGLHSTDYWLDKWQWCLEGGRVTNAIKAVGG